MDISHYRRAEALAQQVMPSWRHAQVHRPHTFEQVGFPVRVESSADLFPLLNTMQENRFEAYQAELGGLSAADVEMITAALADFGRFFARNFHSRRCPLPLATMLAHFVLYTKLRAWHRAASVLEIGPGCGYLSFFLRGDPRLTAYHQVENTESFYLLQSLVNDHCFAEQHVEHAAIDPETIRPAIAPEPLVPNETQVSIELADTGRCHHWPWWRIRELGAHAFDIVTSNANLNEMTEAALEHYARLIGQALRPDGVVIVQSLGGGSLPWQTIANAFQRAGLSPINGSEIAPDRRFAVETVLFARAFPGSADALKQVFDVSTAPRRLYNGGELGRATAQQLSRAEAANSAA